SVQLPDRHYGDHRSALRLRALAPPPARDSEQDRLLELRAGSGLVVGLPFRRRAGLGVVIVRELDRALLAGLTLPQLPLPAAPLAADVLVELAQELRILIGGQRALAAWCSAGLPAVALGAVLSHHQP